MDNFNPIIIVLFFVAIFLWFIVIASDFKSGKNAKLVSAIDPIHNVICYRFAYHSGIQCYKLSELKS
jgi:hypothetical protein